MRYQVYITQKGKLYFADVPALPGCGTLGRSEQEAMNNIRYIIREHRVRLEQRRQTLPHVREVDLTDGDLQASQSLSSMSGNA